MRRVFLLLFLILMLLSGCNPQQASPTLEGSPSLTPDTIDATPSLVQSTLTSKETSTSTPEPTDVTEIPFFEGGLSVTITSIHMLNTETGWAIGSINDLVDHILYSEDGGNTWTDKTPPESAVPTVQDNKTATAYFLDENTAWVRYLDSTIIWNTTDGGQSWEAGRSLDIDIHTPLEIVPDSLQFVNDQIGWVMIYLESGMSHDWIVLYRTEDGGQTWEELIHPSETSDLSGCCKTGLFFFDADTGIVTFGIGPYTAPHYALTVDGGKTWSFTPLNISQIDSDIAEYTNCEAHSPFIFDSTFILLGMSCTTYDDPVTVSHYFYTSDDGGERWSFETYPGGALHFLNRQTGWALGREIYRTSDGGKNWSWMSNVNWDAQFNFITENQGWAVARSGEETGLVMTEDGGKTWALIEPEVGY